MVNVSLCIILQVFGPWWGKERRQQLRRNYCKMGKRDRSEYIPFLNGIQDGWNSLLLFPDDNCWGKIAPSVLSLRLSYSWDHFVSLETKVRRKKKDRMSGWLQRQARIRQGQRWLRVFLVKYSSSLNILLLQRCQSTTLWKWLFKLARVVFFLCYAHKVAFFNFVLIFSHAHTNNNNNYVFKKRRSCTCAVLFLQDTVSPYTRKPNHYLKKKDVLQT